MSNKKIKGITIQLEGDASPLEKTLRDVDNASKETTKELNKINRALKFDTNNTVLLAQKQEVLQEAIQGSTQKLDALRQAQSEVERMFQSGEIDGAAYREFKREIQETEGRLKAYKNQLSNMGTAQADFANATRKLEEVLRESGQGIDAFTDALGSKLVNAIKEGRASTTQLKTAFEQIQRSITESKSGMDQYKTAMSELENAAKRMRQELKLKEQQLKNSGKETELYSARISGLQAQQRNVAQQIMATVSHLSKAKAEYGANSQEVQKLEDKLISLRIANEQLSGQISDTRKAMQNAATSQEQLAASSKDLKNLFTATGKSVDDFASVLGSGLVTAIKQGTANAAQLEQAFNRISRSSLGVNADLDRLRATLRTLDSGGSLDDVRRELEDIERQAQQSEQQVNKLSTAFAALGGAVAAIGLKEVVEKSLEVDDVEAKIDVTFDVPEEGKKAIREALVDVKKYGIDSNEALEGVRRQWALNKDATDASNRAIVEGAAAITKAYDGIDFKELIQETNEIGSELKTSNEEALNIVASLLKIGFPPEQLDIISEYGGQLQRAGYEASEVRDILASSVSTKSWNIDSLLDGLKEGRIRAAEFGNALPTGLATGLRALTNTTKAASEEQLTAMQEGFSKQENALSKSLSKREKAISKAHSQEQKALDKSLTAQTKALDKSLREQQKALEKAHDQKLKMLDAEYMAKLKVIDEERYRAIKAIEDEIAALEGLTEAEDRAAQAAEDAEKRAALVSSVENAKTKKNKEMAIAELAKYDEEMRLKAMQAQRKGQIESLKDQKDDIKDSFDAQKDKLKDEYDLKKEQLKEIQNAEKEALSEQQSLQREALNERQQIAREALSERLNDEMDAVRESHSRELESFKKMNAQKLEIARNPPDSAQFKAIEQQLQGWGAAIAKGGEEGTKAFEEMVRWLDNIEDSTLRNLIGTELFGTKFEDQGDKIIDALLGSKGAADQFKESTDQAKEAVNGMDSSAVTKLGEAFGQMMIALQPLLTVLANFIGFIADLMTRFPVLSSIIVGTVATLGILGGAVAALGPIIGGLKVLLGTGGLLGLFTKLGPILLTLGSKILPLLGRAFTMALGPVGLAITALTLAVPLIIKHWEPIKKFFANLWDGIVSGFQGAVNIIVNLAKMLFNVMTTPMRTLVKLINTFISGLNKVQVPSWVPMVGGKGINIPLLPDIPMLAKGTNFFKGGAAIVGEQGPELVNLPVGSKVHSNGKTNDLLGGGININVAQLHVREEADVNRIARQLYALYDKERRGR